MFIRLRFVFFFSSRRRHTRSKRDWSSDVCSSDLFSNGVKLYHAGDTAVFGDMQIIRDLYTPSIAMLPIGDHYTMGPREAAYASKLRSEERRVGKESRARRRRNHAKKNKENRVKGK